MEKGITQLHIRLKDEYHHALKMHAIEHQMSMKEVIEKLIEKEAKRWLKKLNST